MMIHIESQYHHHHHQPPSPIDSGDDDGSAALGSFEATAQQRKRKSTLLSETNIESNQPAREMRQNSSAAESLASSMVPLASKLKGLVSTLIARKKGELSFLGCNYLT